ncbi:hypothetical protein KPL76_05850 [Subtercola sp. PAMC28395]|uniref:hypothetical protein n=1 Tax=Subtercola sp. PAMC28395 TaxID=2846775 RepID=UPI001C0D7146|nr:hypothetical protein [Subtercola sp. PAMC28395]QWT24881.1 hypothetical protein KPL76_05850 [Subtercola sp. PAMC28395]
MTTDISMVLFRPGREDIVGTFRALGGVRSEFATLRLLVSGNEEQRQTVENLVRESDLTDRVHLTHRFDNLGFASGHNLLLRNAFSAGAKSVLVLNPDTTIKRGAITRLLSYVREDARCALYGPTLERIDPDSIPRSEKITDTLGVMWTKTGRHLDIGQGEAWNITEGRIVERSGVSGACLLVTPCAYDEIVSRTGWFFDDLFLAYREDAELGIRAGLAGITSRVVAMEGFGHVRSVRGATRGKEIPDLLGVRNRFLILFRLRTDRPGNLPLSILRDATVILAAALVERSSWSGVKSAFAIRRFATNTRTRLRLQP